MKKDGVKVMGAALRPNDAAEVTAKSPKMGKKRKQGGKGKWILLAILLIIIAVIFYSMTIGKKNVQTRVLASFSTTAIQKGEIEQTVNVSGTVESADSQKVYSSISGYIADNVPVAVGDVVEKGQLLCHLDLTALEYEIRQQQASISATYSAAQSNIDSARRQYDSARRQYDIVNQQLEDERNASIVNAQTTLDNAETARNTAEQKYNEAKLLYDLGEISEADLEDAGSAIFDAQKVVEDAQKAVGDAYKTAEDSILTAEDSVLSAGDQIQSAQSSTNTQSQQVAIENLQRQLEKADILSPISGTVTFVNIDQGNIAQGLLFVVEDLDQLLIKTRIREYDAPSVHVGQRVRIMSDATGDKEFYGTISYIAPTAVKSATGEQALSGTVEFEAEVQVDVQSDDKQLKAGMNAQLYIVLQEVKDVYTVTYGSIYQDENDQDYIFVKESDLEGKEVVRKIPVTVGVESDYMVEISSPELEVDMQVVDNPGEYLQMQQQLGLATAAASAAPETTGE